MPTAFNPTPCFSKVSILIIALEVCHTWSAHHLPTCNAPEPAIRGDTASCSHKQDTGSWWASPWCRERRGQAKRWSGTVAGGDFHLSGSKSQEKRWDPERKAAEQHQIDSEIKQYLSAEPHRTAERPLNRNGYNWKLDFYFAATANKVLAWTSTCSPNPHNTPKQEGLLSPFKDKEAKVPRSKVTSPTLIPEGEFPHPLILSSDLFPFPPVSCQ